MKSSNSSRERKPMIKRKLTARQASKLRRNTLFARYNRFSTLSYRLTGPKAIQARRIAERAKTLMFQVMEREPVAQTSRFQMAGVREWNVYQSERAGRRGEARRMAGAA
jgi:hypothetical protein